MSLNFAIFRYNLNKLAIFLIQMEGMGLTEM